MNHNALSSKPSQGFIYTYRYFFATCFLCVALGVPWVTSSLSVQLEPYPAVVLPSGARTLLLKDTIDYEVQSVWAQKPGGSWHELSRAELLNPVPNSYFSSLYHNDFGLENNDTKELVMRLSPNISVRRNKVNEQEVDQAKAWLASRLEVLGYDAQTLEIRSENLNIDRRTGVIVERELNDVKSYSLR